MTPYFFENRDTLPQGRASAIEPLPEFIGPYRIEALYRRGGMGALYLAHDPQTHDSVIVKVLSSAQKEQADAALRFETEAHILSIVDHPNIVKLVGRGSDAQGLYIAMEYVSGGSLREWIERHPLSLKQAVSLILEIAYALCHFHVHGVVHRDLKPENILMTEEGLPKLTDLGVARILGEQEEITSDRFIGTPIYMSPEQREHPESVTYASDIYSLGIIAYEIVMGKLSHGQVQLGLIPKGLAKILGRTLQPNPGERYPDVVDLIAALTAYLNSAQIEAENGLPNQLSELFDHLKQIQQTLLPATRWPHFERGLSTLKTGGITGVYLDFLEMPEGKYAIVFAEAMAKGAEGLYWSAILRGMVKTLTRLTVQPAQLVELLNDLLARDSVPCRFSFHYLVLSPQEKRLWYIGCGKAYFWVVSGQTAQKVAAEHPALGTAVHTEFHPISLPWDPASRLFLHTMAFMHTGLTEEEFAERLVGLSSLEVQQQADALLRKAKPYIAPALEQEAFVLLALQPLIAP